MTLRRPSPAALVVLIAALAASAANAQSTARNRQAMDSAWFTGPMLAPSAGTLPQGHVLVEPYFYDVRAPHGDTFGSLTYALYGVADRFTMGVIPTVNYTRPDAGLASSRPGPGDLTLVAQYGLTKFREGARVPSLAVNVQQSLPTAKFDHLGTRASDGFGSGAYTTQLGMYSQFYFWLPNGRILRTRLNLLQGFSSRPTVEGTSVYGTTDGFRGHARPGPSTFLDAAAEYSATRQWVVALDVAYRHDGDTYVTGIDLLGAGAPTPVSAHSGTSDALILAPAVEYNATSTLGVLLGVRLIEVGHRESRSVTPAIAINYVH